MNKVTNQNPRNNPGGKNIGLPQNPSANHGYVTDWQMADASDAYLQTMREAVSDNKKRVSAGEAALSDSILDALGLRHLVAVTVIVGLLGTLVWFCQS